MILIFRMLIVLWVFIPCNAQEPNRSLEPSLTKPRPGEFGKAANPLVVDDMTLQSLYRLGLYSIAVEQCERELQRSGLSRQSTSQWTARLILSVALRDSVATKPEFVSIASRMENATLLAKPAMNLPEQNVDSLWVRFSLVNATYQVIQREIATFLAAPANLARREDCLNSIRMLSDDLAKFRDEVQSSQGNASRLSGRDAANQLLDLATLKNNIMLMQIDFILLRGRLFDAGNNDAVAAGTDAAAAIEKAMNATEELWTGRPSLELAQWDAASMIGNHKEVQTGIRRWIVKHPAHERLPQAIAIALQSSIETRDLLQGDEWLALADEKFPDVQPPELQPPELALARLDWSLFQWRATRASNSAGNNEPNEAALERILKQRDAIASKFGTYWGLRAEATILKSESTLLGNGDSPATRIANRQSMSMVKLELKQLLAANRFDEAIDRLRQSESIASKSNDFEQAFELAKLRLGLLVKQNTTIESPLQEAPAQRLVDLAQQVESASETYSGQLGAADLNRIAEALLLSAWKTESDAALKARLWNRYQQHCNEHLERWPTHTTSEVIRQQLSASYLATGQLESNLLLWSRSPLEVADRKEQLLNALFLFVAANDQREISEEWRKELLNLSSAFQSASRWLLADWSWWTTDGGIDRIFNAEDKLTVDHIARFLDEISDEPIQLGGNTVDVNTLRLCDWIEKDFESRFGWAMVLGNTYLALVDDKFVFDKQPLSDADRDSMVSVFHRLRSTLAKIGQEKNKVLHPKVLDASADIDLSLLVREQAIRSNPSLSNPPEPIVELVRQLDERQKKTPRIAKWTEEIAIVHLWDAKASPANRDAMIPVAVQKYLKLASGNAVGSDGWYHARFRLARCYLLMNQQPKADEIISLTIAMAGELPQRWKSRLPSP